eukprot:6568226-Alexandrium_andersonii.AAC.1
MSASLVGSEMCIRDRFPPSWEAAWSGLGWASACRRSSRSSCPSRTRTVSYTHLTLPTICSV